MSSYLRGFASALLPRLIEAGHLEIEPDSLERVVAFVGDALASQREGRQALTVLIEALVRCPDVVELYADDDELREAVNDLGAH